MRAKVAAEYLKKAKLDPHLIDPTLDAKITDALASVGDSLPKKDLDAFVGRLAKLLSFRWVAQRLLRKTIDAPMRARMMAQVGKQKDEPALVLLAFADKEGCLEEAAQLLFAYSSVPHLPAQRKRLAKGEVPSKKLVAAAKRVLAPSAMKHLREKMLDLHLVLGVILKGGTAADRALVKKARDQLGKFTEDESIRDYPETIDLLAKALGVSLDAPAKGAAKKAPKKAAKKAPKKAAKEGTAAGGPPAARLAAERGWSVAGKQWSARVWLAKDKAQCWFGMFQGSTQILLTMDSHSKPYWTVEIQNVGGNKMYKTWSGKDTSDGFGLPPLEDLTQVPTWIPAASKKLKTTFDFAQGDYNTGRAKKLKAEIRDWLSGG